MSPSNAPIVAQLRQLIYYHLDNDLSENALFFAGRLHALEPRNPDAVHLLSLCYLRLGRFKAAYDYSRDKGIKGQHLGCAYAFAQACLGLERHLDGIGALERARGLWSGRNYWNKHSEVSRRHLPDAAVINCLLGKLWRGHDDTKKAIDCYADALKLNPFMWDAFLELCSIGAVVKPANIFRVTPELVAQLSAAAVANSGTEESASENGALQVQVNNSNFNVVTPRNDPFNSTNRQAGDGGLSMGSSNLFSKLNGALTIPNAPAQTVDVTPPYNGRGQDEDVIMGEGVAGSVSLPEPPQAPLRKSRTLQAFAAETGVEAPKLRSTLSKSKLKSNSEGNDAVDYNRSVAMQSTHKRTISGHAPQAVTAANADPTAAPQRRSVRLFNQIRPSSSKISSATVRLGTSEARELKRAKAGSIKGRSATASTVGRVVSGNRKPVEAADRDLKGSRPPSGLGGPIPVATKQVAASGDFTKEQEALQWLLDLFLKLATGYFQLSRYQCQAALLTFSSLPTQQRETPWVLAQIGKAYFERLSYTEAEEVFLRIKKMAPSRMEDMEIYSTVLWHLKHDVDLAYLSHEMIEMDRLSPQAWCVIGNSFSLQREHDQAIRCFKRATQLHPKFAYAYTLQGHEHVANEEFDKALVAYRSAVSADHRHYNGWYGLGKVYEKMGKFDIAEKHFRSAALINPTNAVLSVCIGVVLEKMKKTQAALVHYSRACELDPRSALARFKKARALMSLRHPREALTELQVLKTIAPDEANVHFMLGRLYKMVRDKTAAIRHFTIALNLDPKASQHIKEAMEFLEEDDDDDFDEEDLD